MSLWKSLTQKLRKRTKKNVRSTFRHLRLESLEDRQLFAATPLDLGFDDSAHGQIAYQDTASAKIGASASQSSDSVSPVLMVISNQDFWYQDYADTRTALEAEGLEVVVAASSTDVARPHANSGQGSDSGFVTPDLALTDIDANDYSAIVFSGGWGMAQYQYGFEGAYHNSAYNGNQATRQVVNDLVNSFIAQDKHVAAICYGVSVLAYARVDGESLLEDRVVTGWNGAAPGAEKMTLSSREQISSNGAVMLASGSIGDASTSTDDVYVDGQLITAEDYRAARAFGKVIAREVIASQEADTQVASQANEETGPSPVLIVIANRDFYHREYYETRESLEAAGLEVVVGAATTETATPHAISVVAGREPNVTPDLPLADVKAEDYSAIVFIGGYGAASYQYANETTYDNPAYRGSDGVKSIVNELVNDFVKQDKYVTAICNGVSVLAWARVDGVSPITGRTVTAWAHQLPTADGGVPQFTRDHVEANGATQIQSGVIGDPTTSADDVVVDGRIITAENYDSAYAFGHTIAKQLLEGRSSR